MSEPCWNCGAPLLGGAAFCSNCGAQAPEPAVTRETQSSASPHSHGQPPQQTPPPDGPGSLNPTQDARMLMIWAAVGVVLAVGTAFWFASNNGIVHSLSNSIQDGRAAQPAQADAQHDGSGAPAVSDPGTMYEEDAPVTSPAPQSTPTGPTDDESYLALSSIYEDMKTLGDRIGNKSDQTGFAYDVFNRNIGSSKRSSREEIVTKSEELLQEIQDDRDALQQLDVAPEHQHSKSELLGLYDLLIRRVAVMRDAAIIALDSPENDAWYPTLQPASTNAREAFEGAYPGAAPVPR